MRQLQARHDIGRIRLQEPLIEHHPRLEQLAAKSCSMHHICTDCAELCSSPSPVSFIVNISKRLKIVSSLCACMQPTN